MRARIIPIGSVLLFLALAIGAQETVTLDQCNDFLLVYDEPTNAWKSFCGGEELSGSIVSDANTVTRPLAQTGTWPSVCVGTVYYDEDRGCMADSCTGECAKYAGNPCGGVYNHNANHVVCPFGQLAQAVCDDKDCTCTNVCLKVVSPMPIYGASWSSEREPEDELIDALLLTIEHLKAKLDSCRGGR